MLTKLRFYFIFYFVASVVRTQIVMSAKIKLQKCLSKKSVNYISVKTYFATKDFK